MKAKTAKEILYGLIPVAVGFLLNDVLLLPLPGILLTALSGAVLFLWGFLSYMTAAPGDTLLAHAAKRNAVGAVMLLLVLAQELALGRYWADLVGTVSQLYFAPCLPAAMTVASPLLSARVWPCYIVAYFLMLAASAVGWAQKNRRG